MPAEITVNGNPVEPARPSQSEGQAHGSKKGAEKTTAFFHGSTRLLKSFDATVIPALRQSHGLFRLALTVPEIPDYHSPPLTQRMGEI